MKIQQPPVYISKETSIRQPCGDLLPALGLAAISPPLATNGRQHHRRLKDANGL